MPLYRPYTTESRVRAELHNSDPSIANVIEQAINDASRYVESYCNRDFWFHEYENAPYVVDLYGKFAFLSWPVITLTSVETNTGKVIDVEDIRVSGGILDLTDVDLPLHELTTDNDVKYLKVKGTFGYPLQTGAGGDMVPPPTIPAPIVRATTLVAAAWSGEYSVERVALDGSRVSIASTEIPSDVFKFLARFKLLVQ